MRLRSMKRVDTAKSKFIQKEKKEAADHPERTMAVASNAVRPVISQENVLKRVATAEEAAAMMTVTEDQVFDSD